MEKKKRNKILLYSFYGVITVAILIFVLTLNDIGAIMKVLGEANINYILVALLLLFIYMALYPTTLCILCRAKKTDIPLTDAYTIGMSEHFFNGITPFSTGGQPFQLYALKRKKVKLSESTGLIMMNFIIFMMATNTFALVSLIYFPKFATNTGMTVVAIIGFTMNFGVLFLMIALATSKRIKKAIIWILRKLAKIKFLTKFLENKINDINDYIEQTQNAFKELVKHKGAFFSCYFIRIITMAIYYAITFYILKALHVEIGYENIFFVMCGSAFAITMVVFLPTPGSSGGIEFAFTNIFATFVPTTMISSVSYGGMLIWRLITYYLTMAISLLFYIGFEIKTNAISRKKEKLLVETNGIAETLPQDSTKEE